MKIISLDSCAKRRGLPGRFFLPAWLTLLGVFGVLPPAAPAADHLAIQESAFSASLVPGKYILRAPAGWWYWCMAPIYDESGKLHVFMSAIPLAGSWARDSTIVHYVADSPEGPYQLVGTVFASKSTTYHNPQITKVGGTYVLVFTMNDPRPPGKDLAIGIATARSLAGPWTESPHNPVIRPSRIAGSPNATHASNPTFLVDAAGRYRIYYKSISDREPGYRTISLAMADKIEGPYADYRANPLISYESLKLDVEDPYAFYYRGGYYMIVEDRMAVREALEGHQLPDHEIKRGGNRPGLIYESGDGMKWGRPQIGYNTNSFYFHDALSRTERPHILWKDGKPQCLFLANHGGSEAGFFLRVNHWHPAALKP